MKKLTLTMALLAALALTACGNKPAEAPTPGIDAPATMPEEGMEIDPEFSVDPETDENAQPAPGECKKYYYVEKVYRPSRENPRIVLQ